ncbi:hypothetical protein VMCG_10948 [Cytospora schulzeri]|uniref:Uncharacterized protein n=1 Tax=Cytospora schulzeri TaxID=448051 RepID=A0A423V7K3_9PEZI|nr:hypothetical protein VMCG_10948 [Valsa malicola]
MTMSLLIGQILGQCQAVEQLMELARHMASMEEVDWTFLKRRQGEPCICRSPIMGEELMHNWHIGRSRSGEDILGVLDCSYKWKVDLDGVPD